MGRLLASTANRYLISVSAAAASVLGTFALSGQIHASVVTVVSLLLVVLILDFFDLWLPHGDRIGVEGAVLAGAVVIVGPSLVLLIALCARVVALLIKVRKLRLEEWSFEISNTALGVFAGALAATPLIRLVPGEPQGISLLAAGLASLALALTQIVYSQLFSAGRLGRRFKGLLLGNLHLQAPLLVAEVSAAVLLVLSYGRMGVWSLVLVVILLLLLRHSYALLLDVRQTYMNTVEVLVDTAESADPRRAGHSERTAQLARSIGEELGLRSADMERLSYAALLHDLEMVGLDPEGADSIGSVLARRAGRVLGNVGFLSNVLPVLQVLDGDEDAVRGADDMARTLAFIIALSSEIDAQSCGERVLSEDGVVRVGLLVPTIAKSRVVGAALRLGFSVPAVP